MYLLKKPRTEEINIYTIDCTPKRVWFLENDITGDLKNQKYKIIIKQSKTMDLNLYRKINMEFMVHKSTVDKKLVVKEYF